MPSLARDSRRILIAGASSLLGAELKSLLEESRFAASDFRLFDEEIAAGTLTEAGGEPAVIQPVEEGSFHRAGVIFFAGSPDFTRANLPAAQASGAKIIDLSGAAAELPGAVAWFPKLDWLRGRKFTKDARIQVVPSAAATASASLALALSKMAMARLSVILFQPVSEAGRKGIEELESQTGQLLSFQGVGQPVFDAQVAFNLLDRYGPSSTLKLAAVRERIRAETRACLPVNAKLPALQVIHAPVFYGTAFCSYAELEPQANAERIARACSDAGFLLTAEGDGAPSNVSASGEQVIQLSKPEADPTVPGTWWFWGAADNIRLPAANALKLAEMLL